MPRPAPIIWSFGLVIVATLCGCGAAPPGSMRPSGSRTDEVARSLLLVTIDTLRADRVGTYGHAAARTPSIDGLARRGVRFERAYAPAPITLPSHATLLTGVNPPSHGARHNGLRLTDSVPTIATVLSSAGFETGAFVSAFPLDRRFGLARGFETYDDARPRQADGRSVNERAGTRTVDAALAWLDARRAEASPYFLWVHLFEPHAPYGPPEARATRPTSARYDDEVTEADRQVGRLIAALDPAAKTLVAVTSDHGEAFGEHGEIGHSVFVYDTTLRVPLVIAGPGVPTDARVIQTPVGLVDVAATLLGLLGQPALPGDGRDLAPVIAGQASDARLLYAESFAPLVDFGWSPLRAVRQGAWKYIAAPKPELYDVSQDPGETRNQVAERPEDVGALATLAEAISPASLNRPPSSDPEAAARLASLGYVSVSSRAASDETTRADPKDRREVAARLAEITSGEIPPDRLVAALTALLRDDPGNPHAELRLGVALVDQGDCHGAEGHLRTAIRSGLPTADPFLSLAYCHRQRGAAAAARRALDEADRLEPGNPIVAANLGLLAFDEGRMDEAVRRLETAVAREPDLHEARFVLARAYARSGNQARAHAHAVELLGRLPPGAPQRSEVERLVSALR